VLTRMDERMLAETCRCDSSQVHDAALKLCEVLLTAQIGPSKAMREFVSVALGDKDMNNRVKGVRLACAPGMDQIKQILPLLDDAEPEVRRLVMQFIGGRPKSVDLLADDDLLRWLNDPDAEVRRLCETALARRGLSPEAVQLGRLITHAKPAVRLEVLKYFYPGSDLDANTWVRHLSHDPAPEVRNAAMRAAVQLDLRNLGDRLDQMAQMDPSPTVRQLAQHYFSVQKKRVGQQKMP
jgi:hypothetical protein